MFALHTSNRTEILFEQLNKVLEHYPYGPFEPISFLIQGRGLERWLKFELAKAHGIFANGRFDFPNRFFGGLALNLGIKLQDERFDRERLLWLIDQALRDMGSEDPVLCRYLLGPSPDLRRFQLARQLANLFDQYQIQRLDWLSAWQQGKTARVPEEIQDMERWQAALWRHLYARLQGHRGLLWQQLIARLAQPIPAGVLPQAVYLFGIGLLPPLMIEVLKALSHHTDVHLFVLSPVEGFWADLPSRRARAKALLAEGPDAEWVNFHHPLLIALGKRGAQFQRLLLERLEPELQSEAFFYHRPPRNVLQHLQNDLARGTLTPPEPGLEVGIELHLCHTPLREVEVVRDRLLAWFSTHPDLKLEEIAVMAPDIGAYQPYLEAVLRDLPHHIADRSLEHTNPLLKVMILALKTLSSRFEWEEVMELLGRPEVAEKFGLTPLEVDRLLQWVTASGIRWGLDSDQRQSLGLPDGEYNSWRLGVDRLLLGWMRDGESAWQEVVPCAIAEGQSGSSLFRLAEFLRCLKSWWERFTVPKTPQEWCSELLAFSQELVAETPKMLAARQELKNFLDTLPAATLYPHQVGLDLVLDWLSSRVEEEYQSHGFLSGGITCCAMLPMRAVPFRVVAVVGMNDGEFPKRTREPAFDLIAALPRLGDRDLRQEQRQQFLELLLSTREHLILTCQGLSPEKNQPLPPAQVVSELSDTLELYGVDPKLWVYSHKSLPFHPVYFRAAEDDLPPKSFAAGALSSHFKVAQALMAPKSEGKFWPAGFALAGDPPTVIDLAELLDFYADAQRWFCRTRLKLALMEVPDFPEAREPFAVDRLLAWEARKKLLQVLEEGKDPWPWLKFWQQAGEWPQGEAGRQAFAIELAKVRRLLSRIEQLKLGQRAKILWHELEVNGVRLKGKIEARDLGSLFVEPANLAGKHFVKAYLQHLFKQETVPSPSWLVAFDSDSKVEVWKFAEVEDGKKRLWPWIEHFLEHWNKPSPWLAKGVVSWFKGKCLPDKMDLPETFSWFFPAPDGLERLYAELLAEVEAEKIDE
jgi:exodeoxyribonuclease V gamma subunit